MKKRDAVMHKQCRLSLRLCDMIEERGFFQNLKRKKNLLLFWLVCRVYIFNLGWELWMDSKLTQRESQKVKIRKEQ